MDEPPVPGAKSLSRSIEIIRDADAAVDHLLANTGQRKAAIFGWGARTEPLFSANQIYCKVMIARGEFDGLCRGEDMEAFMDDLSNAEEVVFWSRPDTTHYVLLDRPERGRTELLRAMDRFLV